MLYLYYLRFISTILTFVSYIKYLIVAGDNTIVGFILFPFVELSLFILGLFQSRFFIRIIYNPNYNSCFKNISNVFSFLCTRQNGEEYEIAGQNDPIERDIHVFVLETMVDTDWDLLKKMYIPTNTPFIIKHIDSSPIEELVYETAHDIESNILINKPYSGDINTLNAICKKLGMTTNCYTPQLFQGNYTAGCLHVDSPVSFVNYNFYLLTKGQKQVQIIPSQKHPLIGLKNVRFGKDSIYVDKSHDDLNDWQTDVPSYYQCTLDENELLCFNNCSCAHKFTNMTDNTAALSVRKATSVAADPIVYLHQMFCSKFHKSISNRLIGHFKKRPEERMVDDN